MTYPLSSLDQLKAKALVWQADDPITGTDTERFASGYQEVDEQLTAGGWPKGQLIETLYRGEGCGELRLWLPLLADFSQHSKVVFINSPHIPYAPALLKARVHLANTFWIQCKNQKETLWALEQCLRESNFGMVLGWLGEASFDKLRRLQQAVSCGHNLGVLFRPQEMAEHSSAASYRLQLNARKQGAEITFIKRRGGWPGPSKTLDLGYQSLLHPETNTLSSIHLVE